MDIIFVELLTRKPMGTPTFTFPSMYSSDTGIIDANYRLSELIVELGMEVEDAMSVVLHTSFYRFENKSRLLSTFLRILKSVTGVPPEKALESLKSVQKGLQELGKIEEDVRESSIRKYFGVTKHMLLEKERIFQEILDEKTLEGEVSGVTK